MYFCIVNGFKMKFFGWLVVFFLLINVKGKILSFEEDKGGIKFSYIFEIKNM